MHPRQKDCIVLLGITLAFSCFLSRSLSGDDKPPVTAARRLDLHGDPLPHGAIARLGTLRFWLGGRFAAFSPNGKILAAANGDYDDQMTIRLWDVATGKEIRQLAGHEKLISSVAFSPNGKLLASASFDKTVRLWDVASGKEIHKLVGHESRIRSNVAFSPMGDRLVSAGADKTVRVWDVTSGKELRRLIGHEKEIWSVAFLPNSETLASASSDDTIRFWDLTTGKELRRFKGEHDGVYSIAFSPDGKLLASGGENHVKLWDLATGRATTLLEEREAIARGMVFSPNGKLLAGGGCLWEMPSRRLIRKFSPHYNMDRFVFSPDSKIVAINGEPLYDVATGDDLRDQMKLFRAGSQVAFTPDDKSVVTAGYHTSTCLWDAGTGERKRQFSATRTYRAQLFVTPDGKTIGVGPSKIALYDAQTGELRHQINGDAKSSIYAIGLTPDGKSVVTGQTMGTLRFWDIATGKQLREVQIDPQLHVYNLAVSPDGRTIATSGSCGSSKWCMAICDAATGKPRHILPISDNCSMVFSPNGRILACDFGCWEVATGKPIHVLPKGQKWLGTKSFSPDGRLLACAAADHTFQLVDVATFDTICEVEGHRDRVECLAFSKDGTKLASGSKDDTVLIWDVKLLLAAQPPQPVDRMERLWNDLAGDNSRRAHIAIWELAADVKQSVPFLATRLRPAKPDADKKLSADELRIVRAIEVLEHIATLEARRLLKTLATGATGAIETDEAVAALARLKKRQP